MFMKYECLGEMDVYVYAYVNASAMLLLCTCITVEWSGRVLRPLAEKRRTDRLGQNS